METAVRVCVFKKLAYTFTDINSLPPPYLRIRHIRLQNSGIPFFQCIQNRFRVDAPTFDMLPTFDTITLKSV